MKEILMNVKNVGDITQDLSPEEKQLIVIIYKNRMVYWILMMRNI